MKKDNKIDLVKIEKQSKSGMFNVKDTCKKKVFTNEIKKFRTLTNMIVLAFFLTVFSISFMFLVSVIIQLYHLVVVSL